MGHLLARARGPGRPKAQRRPTSKLQNTTIRDFGGGLNVVDSEQNLTNKFSPIFDNMVTYTDRRAGPRHGYEMWLKLKQGTETNGVVGIVLSTTAESRVVIINWSLHPFTNGANEHVTISGWDITFNGIVPEMMNRTHGIRRVITDSAFEIVLTNSATATGASAWEEINYVYDSHALGGEPIECKYFANYIILWTSTGEILRINREKSVQIIWNQAITYAQDPALAIWARVEMIASDVFGTQLVCCNGRDPPLSIDFTRTNLVMPLYDDPTLGVLAPAFDACKSAFRYFSIHDTEITTQPEYNTYIRIAAKDSCTTFTTMVDPGDAVDIDMAKVVASPEQTVRSFATIKDALLVITPTATTLLKLGNTVDSVIEGEKLHEPIPVDTLNGFGSNAPRTVVEIGSDVFMIDFNGVPSAKLSAVSNAVVPERVSNYIETMMSSHIARLPKETMRLKVFGFYDSKNKCVHFYLPKFSSTDVRLLTTDPLFFDQDMGKNEETKRTIIMRIDAHHLEEGDLIDISNSTNVGLVDAANINGRREVKSVLNDNYIMVSIGEDLPTSAQDTNISGGGTGIQVRPVNDGMIGYVYHYVPQLKLFAWSRFKTAHPQARQPLLFNCGCGTIEGRAFLFTPDGYMMRYGSVDTPVYADWYGMYDYPVWSSGGGYWVGARVFDTTDGLVYICLQAVTTVASSFPEARAMEPDAWEEYKGEAIHIRWELPWADFGARQSTKALRFIHADASGNAAFTVRVYADNIYKDAATGKRTPARELQFVPNEAGAYGAGMQLYGAGRRTREQKLWQVPVKFKLLKAAVEAQTTGPLSISALSFMYQKGLMVR